MDSIAKWIVKQPDFSRKIKDDVSPQVVRAPLFGKEGIDAEADAAEAVRLGVEEYVARVRLQTLK